MLCTEKRHMCVLKTKTVADLHKSEQSNTQMYFSLDLHIFNCFILFTPLFRCLLITREGEREGERKKEREFKTSDNNYGNFIKGFYFL